MEIWQSLEFGAWALSLKLAAGKSQDEIERLQRSRLEELVRHARENSEFWSKKLASIDDSEFNLSDLPTSSKAELMENFDRAVTVDDVRRDDVERFVEDESNLGKYFRDKYVLSHTSGSQGQPLLIVQPKDNVELLFALQVSRGNSSSLTVGEVVKHLFKPAKLAAVTLKKGFFPSAVAFEYMPEGAKQFIEVLPLSIDDENLIDRLTEYRPTHLTSYSSILHELARQVEARKLSLKPDLEQVVNISERLLPQARAHYEELFGAPVLDDYGMGECMFLTNGCRTSGGMHVNSDWAIMEVVDDDNQPVPDGEKGAKVLVTNLANYVQPIIRYEVGDIVTMAAEHCDCGSQLPLIEGIEGRDSDMFYIESDKGERALSPVMFELALDKIVDAREYQLIQEERNRFKILIEPLPDVKFDHGRAEKVMSKQLHEYKLADRIKVDLEVVERLESDGENKFKRVVSKVDKPEKGKKLAAAS
jgi:phenylacetate-coenzyme A ligase PaaK-like adenylate-forming protein